jgi:hypothetical protein
MCACWGRLLSDGMRARLLIHACETTVTPAHDEPLEGQAARAQTNSGYARNGTLFPQVYRAAAPPLAQKNSHSMVFFPVVESLDLPLALRRCPCADHRQRSRRRSPSAAGACRCATSDPGCPHPRLQPALGTKHKALQHHQTLSTTRSSRARTDYRLLAALHAAPGEVGGHAQT